MREAGRKEGIGKRGCLPAEIKFARCEMGAQREGIESKLWLYYTQYIGMYTRIVLR